MIKHTAQRAGVFLLLVFSSANADSAPPNNGATTWVLLQGQGMPSRPPRTPRLRVEGQKLSGSTGCNSFTAALTKKADARVAIEQVALTRMLCAPEENKIETVFVRALKQTAYLEQKGKRLIFLSDKRQPLLVWKRQKMSGDNGSASRKLHARAQHPRRTTRARKDRSRPAVGHKGCWGYWADSDHRAALLRPK